MFRNPFCRVLRYFNEARDQMKSVRLRLLTMALLPLVVLMPLLLGTSMARWADRFDALLISNIESDLRIADQYFQSILERSGREVTALANSTVFQASHAKTKPEIRTFLAKERQKLGLDFLYFLPKALADRSPWPVIRNATSETTTTAIDIFQAQDLARLSPALAQQAEIPLLPTQAAIPTTRTVEDRGLVVHTATAVHTPSKAGVLVGGTLLNRNLEFIDRINELVYLSASPTPTRQGTATLFLEDVRISTNVRLFEDVRALGTRVSAAVRGAVLDDGETWLDRAYVVNDWYISGYLPITDSFEERVGMLYVGFLEAPFAASKKSAFLIVFTAFTFVLALSIPLFLWMARGIFSPLERMTQTMRRVEDGNLNARIGKVGNQDEIGQVASHLDSLLDQVQDRDQALRLWADELNERVDKRTEELQDANTKLEATYRQLVTSEKLASIGEIAAGVAHEINNPVAVIQGNVDVIRETLGEGAVNIGTELTLVDQQVQRINLIVGKLLQFAGPEDFASVQEDIYVADVLEDCLVLVDHVLTKSKITVEKNLRQTPPIRMNIGEMQQVTINLIINAAQAMQGNGALTIATQTQERDGHDGVSLSVCDTGPGVALDKIETVFDPFFTTKQGEGTGLGLSISQTLVQNSGGVITVENLPDGGAKFAVWLPAAEV